MARNSEVATEAPPAGPAPGANPDLLGHEAAEEELRHLYETGRLPHAILLTGPRGIGKATLAFRLARYVLAESEPAARTGPGLAVDPASGVSHRVAAGGHADLLTVERTWDPQRRRLRADIVVDDAREIAAFFRLTAAEEGWRIVVVDGAEEMTRSAANALLKILEEPPPQALLLLVSHAPARLLPTIRSRCRRLRLRALSPTSIGRLLCDRRPETGADATAALAVLAEGSPGRAIELAEAGGVGLYRALLDLLSPAPQLDLAALHALADRLRRPEAEPAYRAAQELLARLLSRVVAAAVGVRTADTEVVAGETAALRRLAGLAPPAAWAELPGAIEANFLRAGELNLDHKQAMLDAFFAIAAVAR